MSNAIETQGTTFHIATDAQSPTTYVKVGEMVSFDGPDGSAGDIDTTHLESQAKEYLTGLPDEGQISFSLNYLSADQGQDECLEARRLRQKRQMKLTLSNGELWLFEGFVKKFQISGKVEDKVTAQVVVRITGPVSQV